MTNVQGIHHVSLSVTDLGKSVQWYGDVLGLEVTAEIEGAGFRRTRLRAPESGVTLTLTAHEAPLDGPFDERRSGMDHIAFSVGGIDDVQALKAQLEQLGVDHSEVKTSGSGTVLITLRDPDNIQLEVFGGPFDPAIAAGGPAR